MKLFFFSFSILQFYFLKMHLELKANTFIKFRKVAIVNNDFYM